ncbi:MULTISPECIES: epoxide hydrolase family protein [Actinosynnema]|uniref:epoxide hydrolase family protein n=1 Tax=Actinosynnema TaxID=40566 RepID=UPI0020A38B66|nr:epoxide hydrolase family protein [Actinosynnema pretiosum]
MSNQPVLSVSDDDLADLRDRLRRTRWAARWPAPAWEAGTDPDELERLARHWADGYDWRAREAEINALPSHFAEVDGVRLHYLRYDGADDALPLVLTNGWPSTFYELVGLAERLAARGFTTIVPSLPGYPLSAPRPSLTSTPTHELWHRLMREELGFARYGAHGGDLGAGVSTLLAKAHPESVAGLHLMAVAPPTSFDTSALTDAERAHLTRMREWWNEEGAYEHQHRTRPLTLAPALSDSPVGLLSWVLEKYRAWSHTGLRAHSDDFLLTQASLYWFTNSIGTSLRPYYERGRAPEPDARRVEVPTAVALFPGDLAIPPREWAERTYRVTRWTEMPRGGHFAPVEEPELLADDLAGFFGDLR